MKLLKWIVVAGFATVVGTWLLALYGCGGGGGPVRHWAQLPPREATYVGSEECKRCHAAQHGIWKQTFHARMIRPVNEPGALMGVPPPAGINVVFTMGSHFRQRFIFLEGGEYWVARGQYVKATNDPSSLQPVKDRKWESCMPCHTVGYDPTRTPPNKFAEISIGCEACHGPGSVHVASPSRTNIVSLARLSPRRASDVCGKCHNRYSSVADVEGLKFFLPGMDLQQQLQLEGVEMRPGLWMDIEGTALPVSNRHRQQYFDWLQSAHAAANVGCLQCHLVHKAPDDGDPRSIDERREGLCVSCHTQFADPVKRRAHTNHPAPTGRPGAPTCAHCHMPAVASSGTKLDYAKGTDWDIHSHTFKFIPPSMTLRTLKAGAKEGDVVPNSCMAGGCHSPTSPYQPNWAMNNPDHLRAAQTQVEQWYPSVRKDRILAFRKALRLFAPPFAPSPD